MTARNATKARYAGRNTRGRSKLGGDGECSGTRARRASKRPNGRGAESVRNEGGATARTMPWCPGSIDGARACRSSIANEPVRAKSEGGASDGDFIFPWMNCVKRCARGTKPRLRGVRGRSSRWRGPRCGKGQYYGNYRLAPTQLVCEECGHIMGFETEELQKNRS